jgi:hypothetical protein
MIKKYAIQRLLINLFAIYPVVLALFWNEWNEDAAPLSVILVFILFGIPLVCNNLLLILDLIRWNKGYCKICNSHWTQFSQGGIGLKCNCKDGEWWIG